MGRWWTANGGPLALVIVGLGVGGFTNRWVGLGLILGGIVWWLGTHVLKRLPWEVRRKRGFRGSGPAHQGWVSPDDLGDYLDSINQKMEEKGFGSNPNLTPATQPKAPTPS